MSDLNVLTLLAGLLMLGALVSFWFYVWAWIMGPAVRHLGKCWAQGWVQGLGKPYQHTGPAATLEKVGLLPPRVEGPVHTETIEAPAPAKTQESTPQYTITGRRIR